ncbi:hypothetical protein [Paenibacillus sp. GYB003]|uniref:hypothetical protein n=1 Tax=Paenibacillus sp. GYB003 TaxID=2994392 RepID=UPI002F9693FF
MKRLSAVGTDNESSREQRIAEVERIAKAEHMRQPKRRMAENSGTNVPLFLRNLAQTDK